MKKIKCGKCESENLIKDAMRKTGNGYIYQYKCLDCKTLGRIYSDVKLDNILK